MRLCLVAKYPPIQGGVSTLVHKTAQALAERGHRVHLVTNAHEVESGYRALLLPGDRERLERHSGPGRVRVHLTTPIDGAGYAQVPASDAAEARLFGLGLEVARAEGCDLVAGWFLHPYGAAAVRIADALGLPSVVLHAGSDVAFLARHPDLAPAFRWLLGRADRVVTGRAEAVRAHLRDLGADEDRLRVPRPGLVPLDGEFLEAGSPLDVDALLAIERDCDDPLDDRLRGLRKRINARGSGEDPTEPVAVIGAYGKVAPAKHSLELLEALDTLAARGVPFRFLTIPCGAATVLVPYLDALLARPRLAARTTVLPPIAPWRVAGYLRRCDVVCALETTFGFDAHHSEIPRETLAAGALPVVSSHLASRPFWRPVLRPGETCLMVARPEDPSALARTLHRALVDTALRAELRLRGALVSRAVERHARGNPFAELLETIAGELP